MNGVNEFKRTRLVTSEERGLLSPTNQPPNFSGALNQLKPSLGSPGGLRRTQKDSGVFRMTPG